MKILLKYVKKYNKIFNPAKKMTLTLVIFHNVLSSKVDTNALNETKMYLKKRREKKIYILCRYMSPDSKFRKRFSSKCDSSTYLWKAGRIFSSEV